MIKLEPNAPLYPAPLSVTEEENTMLTLLSCLPDSDQFGWGRNKSCSQITSCKGPT